MRRIQSTVLPILLLICLLISSIGAAAADEHLGEIVDYSLLTEDSEAGLANYPVTEGSYLSSGSAHISYPSSRTVTISGSTTAYKVCDKVKVTLRLQRLEDGYWVTVKTLGAKTATNAYYVSNSATYTVAGGYYYRVSGAHTVIKGNETEAGTSATDGIWVA